MIRFVIATLALFTGLAASPAGGSGEPPATTFVGGIDAGRFDKACRKLVSGSLEIPSAAPVLTKRVDRVLSLDGSVLFTVTLHGDVSPTTNVIDVLDCAWVDFDGNGRWNGEYLKPMLARAVPVARTSDGAELVFTAKIFGVGDLTVCDAAAVVTTTPRRSPVTASAITGAVCSSPDPDPVVPESPLSPLLPLGAAAVLGSAVYLSRRRSASR